MSADARERLADKVRRSITTGDGLPLRSSTQAAIYVVNMLTFYDENLPLLVEAIGADRLLKAMGAIHGDDTDGGCWGESQTGCCQWSIESVPCPLVAAGADE